jgi:D-alanyl-D-alanine carboxypeptidase
MNTKKTFITIILLVPILSLLAHWLVTRPQDAKQFVYPVESITASTQSKCSTDSPEWMGKLMSFSFKHRGSLANQIAYRDVDGKIHHCEGGWADHFLGAPVNEKHRYRYASLTKLITADLILQLIDAKKLSLDTGLLEIFPEIKPLYDERISNITIGYLLDHSAGFDRLTPEGDVMFTQTRSRRWCPNNINRLAEQRLHFNPGEKQIYSNLGYCLLGMVIERVTGISYKDYAEQVYDLDDFYIKFVDGAYLKDEVKYDFRFDDLYTRNYYKKYDLAALAPAAGLSGNAISFVQLMEKILSRKGTSLLDAPIVSRCKKKIDGQCFGFAFDHSQIKRNSQLQLFTHRGYLPGSSSLVIVDNQGGILVLLNASAVPDALNTNKQTIKMIYGVLKNQYQL